MSVSSPSILTAALVRQLLRLLPHVVSAQEQRSDVDIRESNFLNGLGNRHSAWSSVVGEARS